MKTVFIPIAGRLQARNILRTDVFKVLNESKDICLVIFAPLHKAREYRKEFKGEDLIFEGIEEMSDPISPLDAFFNRLAVSYIDSQFARFNRKEWLLLRKRRVVRYLLSMFLLILFGNIKLLRNIGRFADEKFVRDDRFGKYFDRYHPDIVFLPRIEWKLDKSFLRHAKRRHIMSIGMISSWDNITVAKFPFRLLPDKLIVHNEILKREAIEYLDMREKDIYVSGMQHFDYYVKSKRLTREDFCTKLGVDPGKRILLFASIGSALNPTEWQVLSLLDKAIGDGKLPRDLVILFRLHPSEKTAIDATKYGDSVILDDSKSFVGGKKKYTEILKKDTEHLADSLYHSEITLATASTMTIDAAAFDKPSINIAFDGWEQKPFHESVRRFYESNHEHYQPIVKSGGVRIAYSIGELIQYINMYLKDPSIDHEGRKRIVKEQCYRLDGRAGERIGNYLLSRIIDVQV